MDRILKKISLGPRLDSQSHRRASGSSLPSQRLGGSYSRGVLRQVPLAAICLWLLAISGFDQSTLGIGWGGTGSGCAAGQEPAEPTEPRRGVLVRVPLPIDAQVRNQVTRAIEQIATQAPPRSVRANERPVLILRLDTDRGGSGAGSNLADCLALAELLTSEGLAGFQTVTFLPAPPPPLQGAPPPAALEGHAILVALASETIVLHPTLKLGPVSNEARPNALAIDIYRNVASRRLNLPLPLSLALVDPARSLHAVTLEGGAEELVDDERLAELETAGRVIQKSTLSTPGSAASFSAADLQRFSVSCDTAADMRELAARLNVNSNSLRVETAGDEDWKAVQFELPEFIDSHTVNWGIRSMQQQVNQDNVTMLVIRLRDARGDVDACVRLAEFLADFDSRKIQTVAFVEGSVAGPAALIAAGCEHILIQKDARWGGAFDGNVPTPLSPGWERQLTALAERRDRDPGLIRALIDRTWQPLKFRQLGSGAIRWMTREEQSSLADADRWQMVGPVDVSQPLTANELESLGVARAVLGDLDELKVFYQLEALPAALKPTTLDRNLTRFARFLTQPLISILLLMMAISFLSGEMSSPGVGLPGFIGTLFLVLFFWSHYFDGNATWLEIMMFVTGIVFIIIELFVTPGFGLFGIGGILLMVVSLVLATQTFVLPRTAEDFQHLPVSLGMALAVLVSFFISLAVLRKYAKNIPYFRAMMLEPPSPTPVLAEGDLGPTGEQWVGRRGVAVTPLIPSGKAKIAGQLVDVITDGEILDPQTAIEVTEMMGNRIVVRGIGK